MIAHCSVFEILAEYLQCLTHRHEIDKLIFCGAEKFDNTFTFQANWYRAQHICIINNGRLATIGGELEQNKLKLEADILKAGKFCEKSKVVCFSAHFSFLSLFE